MARAEALDKGNWIEVYSFIHPNAKFDCTEMEFGVKQVIAWRTLAILMGISDVDELLNSEVFRLVHNLDKDAKLENRVEEVWRAGNKGYIDIDGYHNGKQIEALGEDLGPHWEYFEGEWFKTSEPLECKVNITDIMRPKHT